MSKYYQYTIFLIIILLISSLFITCTCGKSDNQNGQSSSTEEDTSQTSLPQISSIDTTQKNIIILLDASSTMLSKIDGREKFKSVLTPLYELMVELERMDRRVKGDTIQVMVRLYGPKLSDSLSVCEASLLAYPLAKPDKKALRQALTDIKLDGVSCLTYALGQLQKDLKGEEGKLNNIILLTDDFEGCPDKDPLKQIEILRSPPYNAIFTPLALNVDSEIFAELNKLMPSVEDTLINIKKRSDLNYIFPSKVMLGLGYNARFRVINKNKIVPFTIEVYDTLMKTRFDSVYGENWTDLKLSPAFYDFKIINIEHPIVIKDSLGGEPQYALSYQILHSIKISNNNIITQGLSFDDGTLTVISRTGENQLPSTVKVYLAGTDEEITSAFTRGHAVFNLPPLRYDIIVINEALDLPEKPQVTLRNIQVLGGRQCFEYVQFRQGELLMKVEGTAKGIVGEVFIYLSGDTSRTVPVLQGIVKGERSFTLPPGRYDIIVQNQSLELLKKQEKVISRVYITAGEVIERKVRFSQGSLQVKVISGNEVFSTKVVIYSSNSSAERELITEALVLGQRVFHLPPAMYDIQIGNEESGEWIYDVVVSPGRTTEKTIEIKQNRLTIEILRDNEETSAIVQLTDLHTKKIIFDDYVSNSTSINLKPGTYTLKVNDGEDIKEIKALEIKFGESKTVSIDLAKP